MKRLAGSVFFALVGIVMLASCGSTTCPAGYVASGSSCVISQAGYNTGYNNGQYPQNGQYYPNNGSYYPQQGVYGQYPGYVNPYVYPH
jgi:hypothetical protein